MMNGEMFRTVSAFRQHVAGVDPPIRYNPYSQSRASQNRPLAEQQKQRKILNTDFIDYEN